MSRPTVRPLVLAAGTDPASGGIQAVADQMRLAVAARVIDTAGRRKLAVAWECLLAGPADPTVVMHVGLLKLLPLLPRPRGRRVLFLHGVECWRPPGRLARRLLGAVDLFLSNSDHTWERFLTFAPQLAGRPHATTALGLGEPLAGPTPPPADAPTAVILGRMDRGEDYKGHRELIAAWPRVRERVPAAELVVAGDGDLRPDLERLAGPGVRFVGRVSESQKQELLARSRCLVMPSRGEGFGLVYLEAMRVGRPCLVGDRDAGREVVNPPEAGLAVNPDDPAAVAAAAAARLLTPGAEWDAWSAAARRRYEGRFTAAHFQARLRAALGPGGG